MTQRAFKGIWIPREIWLESHLTAVERVLWAEIDSFTDQGSSYYKTNQQAAEELGISVRNVSRVIKRLEELGVIEIGKKGVRRVLRSTGQMPRVDNLSMDTMSTTLDTMSRKGRHDVQEGWTPCPPIKNNKNTNKNTKKTQEVLSVPFNDLDDFTQTWKVWKEERQHFKKGSYSHRAQQQGINKLNQLSAGDWNKAKQIINQSIEYGWQGFFPIRQDKTGQRPNLDARQALDWANK